MNIQEPTLIRLICYINELNLNLVNIKKHEIEIYAQQLCNQYNFNGLHGVIKYMIINMDIVPKFNALNSFISILYMFVDAPMKSQLFYNFWSVCKILIKQFLKIETSNIEGVKKLIIGMQQTLLRYFDEVCNEKQIKDNKDLQKFLESFLKQFLVKLIGLQTVNQKIKFSIKQIVESTLKNKKIFQILCLIFMISFQFTLYIQNCFDIQFLKGLIRILDKKNRMYQFIRLFQIITCLICRLTLTHSLQYQDSLSLLYDIIIITNNKVYAFYHTVMAQRSLLIRLLSNFPLIQDLSNTIKIMVQDNKHPIQLKNQQLLLNIKNIMAKQIQFVKLPQLISLNNIIYMLGLSSQSLHHDVLKLTIKPFIQNQLLIKYLEQNNQQLLIKMIQQFNFTLLNTIEQCCVVYFGLLNQQRYCFKAILEIQNNQLCQILKTLMIGYNMGHNQEFIISLIYSLLQKVKQQLLKVYQKPSTFLYFYQILCWVDILLNSSNHQIWICHNCDFKYGLSHVCQYCDCLNRPFVWHTDRNIEIITIQQQYKVIVNAALNHYRKNQSKKQVLSRICQLTLLSLNII